MRAGVKAKVAPAKGAAVAADLVARLVDAEGESVLPGKVPDRQPRESTAQN